MRRPLAIAIQTHVRTVVPVLLSMKKNPFIYTKYYYSIIFLIFISGFDCETTLSDCDSDPCLHGGTCGHDFYTASYTTAIYGGTPITWPVYELRYYCYCAAAYSGKYSGLIFINFVIFNLSFFIREHTNFMKMGPKY